MPRALLVSHSTRSLCTRNLLYGHSVAIELHQPEKFRDYCYTQITSLRSVVIPPSFFLSLVVRPHFNFRWSFFFLFFFVICFIFYLLITISKQRNTFLDTRVFIQISFHNQISFHKISSKSIPPSIIISVHADRTSDRAWWFSQKSTNEQSTFT